MAMHCCRNVKGEGDTPLLLTMSVRVRWHIIVPVVVMVMLSSIVALTWSVMVNVITIAC